MMTKTYQGQNKNDSTEDFCPGIQSKKIYEYRFFLIHLRKGKQSIDEEKDVIFEDLPFRPIQRMLSVKLRNPFLAY